MSFFYTSLEEINDHLRLQIQQNAISAKGATYEDFEGFLKTFDKQKVENKEMDHKANLAMLNKKL